MSMTQCYFFQLLVLQFERSIGITQINNSILVLLIKISSEDNGWNFIFIFFPKLKVLNFPGHIGFSMKIHSNKYLSKLTIGLVVHETASVCNWEITQQNSYSIRYLLGTVTTKWPHSDGVVTVDNYWQHGDYTVNQLCSHHAAGS